MKSSDSGKPKCTSQCNGYTEEGIILEVHANHVLIETEPAMMCASCSGRGACGFNDDTHKRIISALSDIPLLKGDRVFFSPGRSPLFLAALIYLVPLLLFTLGVIVFLKLSVFHNQDLNGIAGGLCGLVISGFILYLGNKRFSNKIKARVISKK